MSDYEKEMLEWVNKAVKEIENWGDPPTEHERCAECYIRALCLVVGNVAVQISYNADQARELLRVASEMFGEKIAVDAASFKDEIIHCSGPEEGD